jgi:maleylpyruvate isomerase
MRVTLHGYWRSSAAYRVRIALNLKGIGYDQVSHDLRAGEQRDADYLAIAPHGLVPALEVGSRTLKWADPPLLPGDADEVVVVRSMAALVGCDIHPLNNLRVLNRLQSQFGASKDQVKLWVRHWIAEGFAPLEQLVARHGAGFAFGRAPTLADCYLVPQLYNAQRFGVDLSPYPRLVAAGEAALALPAVQAAHPDRQPDAG